MQNHRWYKNIFTLLYLICGLLIAGGSIGLLTEPKFYLLFVGLIAISGAWFVYLSLVFRIQEPDKIESDLRKWLDHSRLRRD
jgi:membrane associated rhomboid family serine protease